MILLLVGAFSALHVFSPTDGRCDGHAAQPIFVFRSVPFQNSRSMPRVTFTMDLLSSLDLLHASRSTPSPELSSLLALRIPTRDR